MQQQVRKNDVNVNGIARQPGTGKIRQDFYNPKAPHNQPALFRKQGK